MLFFYFFEFSPGVVLTRTVCMLCVLYCLSGGIPIQSTPGRPPSTAHVRVWVRLAGSNLCLTQRLALAEENPCPVYLFLPPLCSVYNCEVRHIGWLLVAWVNYKKVQVYLICLIFFSMSFVYIVLVAYLLLAFQTKYNPLFELFGYLVGIRDQYLQLIWIVFFMMEYKPHRRTTTQSGLC